MFIVYMNCPRSGWPKMSSVAQVLQPSEVWRKERTALIRLDQTASVTNVITGSVLGHWGDLNVGTMTLLWLYGLFYCGKYE